MVEFGILGPLRASVDGVPVELGGGRQRAVLAVLLLARNSVVSVDRLLDLVWDEDPPPTAETALQGHVSRLRRLLGADAIETRAPGYLLRTEPGAVDADRFERLCAAARSAPPARAAELLRDALGLWRGPALADMADAPFAIAEVARLDELKLQAIEDRIEADLACARHDELVAELEALVASNPYRERLHGQLMLALYRTGRQADALAAYTRARAALDEGLGIDPGPDLQALQTRVLNQDPTLAPPAAPGSIGNLPAASTPIVGRREELVSALEFLAGPARCLTLTGPGGTGKTRLALELARLAAPGLHDGAWFVDCSQATTAPAAISALRAGLGVAESLEPDPLVTLREHLRGRRLLCVLDNCEQVPELGPVVADLLAAAPGVRVLATSRTPLGIGAEQEYAVRPLGLPDPGTAVDPEAPPDAVALFVARAQAVTPGFRLTPQLAPDVAELCRRLDGLPLAIELAASRARLLAPAAILARVGAGLDVLRAERRDLPARQRTLEATIDWSYRLLGGPAARAFWRASVFAGGFGLDAFDIVCAEPGEDALELLGELVAGSLVVRRDGEDGQPRFGTLETIRAYALARLAASGEEEAVRERHRAWCLAIAAAGADGLADGDAANVAVVDLEHDNIRASLDWLGRTGRTAESLDLAAAMSRYWLLHGHYLEGRNRLTAALEASTGSGTNVAIASRATAMRNLSCILSTRGEVPEALACASESVRLWESTGDRGGLADALRVESMALLDAGELVQARRSAERAIEHARAVGNQRVMRYVLSELAFLAIQGGDTPGAARLLVECVDAMRAAHDLPGLGGALNNLSTVRQLLGDLEGAEAAARESLATLRVVGDTGNVASALVGLAGILLAVGRLPEARASAAEGLLITWEAGSHRELPSALEIVGDVLLAAGEPARAVRLYAAAGATRSAQGLSSGSHEIEQLDVSLGVARAALGRDEFDRAWAMGATLSAADAVRDALAG